MTTSTYQVDVTDVGRVPVTVDRFGAERPFLLLHGGAGPQSVLPFGELLATTYDVEVVVPTHPGFAGTPRPDTMTGIPALAELYRGLLDELELTDVTSLDVPAPVLWGDSDRIVDPEYGRAYAEAIPGARFQLLPDTGHAPQQETPDQVLRAISDICEPRPVRNVQDSAYAAATGE